MRFFFFISLFITLSFSLTLDEAKHLLNRTSFGYTKSELELFQSFTKEEAVEYLISQAKSKDFLPPPSNIKEVSTFEGRFKDLSREERRAKRKAANKKMEEIKVWWYQSMLKPKYSFREKMTLFWHNHFTSEYKVVKSPFMMFNQNLLYRDYALGYFDELLHKSSKDMAMLLYLDSNSNKKNNPNENYVRELLELFTLGEGNYTEDDVKEAARAFTGLRVNRKKANVKLVPKLHDSNTKTFMGYKGNFDGSDIIDIILRQEQTAKFITMKLYKEFISEKYDRKEVESLATIFRKSSYDISILMKNLLLSESFWAKENRANMIKSPVEYMVSLLKSLDIKPEKKQFKYLVNTGKKLGQDIFNPPSVKGWGYGKDWIDSTSLVNRTMFSKTVIKRKVNKKILKQLNIKSFREFANYFYVVEVNSNLDFVNNKKIYMTLLSKPIYNLK